MNATAGAVSEHYLPYGYRWPGEAADPTTSIGFGGYEAEPGTRLFHTQNRDYAPYQKRWLSPDPAGWAAATPSNPQSWNRYAYVTGTPLDATDPLGLNQWAHCHPDMSVQKYRFYGCAAFYATIGFSADTVTGCTIDGVTSFCSIVSDILGMGGGVECPDDGCSKWGSDPYTGQPAYLTFTASANASGYLSNSDWSQGVNEMGGMFVSDHIYALVAGMVDAIHEGNQYERLSANVKADSRGEAYIESSNAMFVRGGHANFPINCGVWAACLGRNKNGVHVEVGPQRLVAHDDTTSYYLWEHFNFGTFNLFAAIVHGVVDGIYGHTIDTFPH